MKVGAVRFKVQEFNALLLALKKEVLSATKFRQPLETDNNLWSTVSKETGLHSCDCMKLNSANNLNIPGSGLFPRYWEVWLITLTLSFPTFLTYKTIRQ